MNSRKFQYFLLISVTVLAVVSTAIRSPSATERSVSELAKKTHFHGIAVQPGDPSRLYLASHHGLFEVTPDGKTRRVSKAVGLS